MTTVRLSALVLMFSASSALAHGYRAGPLEITHPAIMVPYFLGAVISAAHRTHLIEITAGGHGLATPMRVEIPPGKTLDLSRHRWCLFMSGITKPLEADMGAVAGQLLFERQGVVDIEFMIDASPH